MASVEVAAIAEQVNDYRKLLRAALESHPGPLPKRLADWWTAEQLVMQQERDAKLARIAQRRAALEAKIAELQAELAGL